MRVRPVPAVTRSIAILRLLGTQKQALGVKAISDKLGLVPSTCLHILRVLVAENFVRVDPETKRYSLGSGMVSLARSVLEDGGFASLARPCLDRLSAARNIAVLGVEITSRHTTLVLAASQPDQPLKLHADVGMEFPLLTSATGRLVAAYSGEPEVKLRAMFDATVWDKRPAFDDWRAEVREARIRGWSLDRDGFKNGITAVAVPVLSPGDEMVHSIVAMGLSVEMQKIDLPALVRDMQHEAQLISKQMHGRAGPTG